MKLEINDKIIKDMLSQTIKVFEDDDTNEDRIAAMVEEIIKLWIIEKK